MAKLRSVLGYLMAVLTIPIMFTGLIGFVLPTATDAFVAATGLEHSPNWSGGAVVRTIDHGGYQTDVHRPVFDALIGEHREGFIQVDWRPEDTLPARIDEEIDVDADGQSDFRVELDTAARQATLTPYSANVGDVEWVYDLGERLALRVRLANPRR